MTRPLPASALQVLGAPDRALRLTAALPLLARQAGWLQVQAGQVWITRSSGGTDHVLAAGEAIALGRGQQMVAEPWHAGRVVQLRWVAGATLPQAWQAPDALQAPVLRPGPVARPGAAGLAWRALSRVLAGAAASLAAAARNAESRASMAQGRICAGDSMAASGALQ